MFKGSSRKCENKASVSNKSHSQLSKTIKSPQHQKCKKGIPVPFVKLERLDMSSFSKVSLNNEDHSKGNDSVDIKGENSSNQDENDNVDNDDW